MDATFFWDGSWFRTILADGYVVTDPSFETWQNPAFLPGIVWVTEPFTWLLEDRLAAFLVANALSLAAFVAVYVAVRAWASERRARGAVLALACWPTSFFLWTYYSEALFITASAVAFWADARSKRATAAVAIVAASSTRVVGLLFGPVMAAARIWRLRRVDLTACLYAASSGVALALVAIQQQAQTGDPLTFSQAQGAWARDVSLPWEPITRALAQIRWQFPQVTGMWLNLVAMVGVGAAVCVVVLRARRGTWPAGPALWAAVAWAAPLCTTLPSAQSRFVLAAWPVTALAADGNRRGLPKSVRPVACGAGAVVTAILLRQWVSGFYVA